MVALMVFADHIPSELRWWQRDQWRREWYPANSGTTAGTYTITVTGTAGSLSNSTNVGLIVEAP